MFRSQYEEPVPPHTSLLRQTDRQTDRHASTQARTQTYLRACVSFVNEMITSYCCRSSGLSTPKASSSIAHNISFNGLLTIWVSISQLTHDS